jgi:hypothetical protein
MLADMRCAIRAFRRAPAFVLAAVLSLAPGIGANTAVFSLVNAVLLRTLPVREPGLLVIFVLNTPDPFAGSGIIRRYGVFSSRANPRDWDSDGPWLQPLAGDRADHGRECDAHNVRNRAWPASRSMGLAYRGVFSLWIACDGPLDYAALTVGLFALALTASWIPARRAAMVDPMIALRHE